jgi:hypothetical protein
VETNPGSWIARNAGTLYKLLELLHRNTFAQMNFERTFDRQLMELPNNHQVVETWQYPRGFFRV